MLNSHSAQKAQHSHPASTFLLLNQTLPGGAKCKVDHLMEMVNTHGCPQGVAGLATLTMTQRIHDGANGFLTWLTSNGKGTK